jgi:hypothetical protein
MLAWLALSLSAQAATIGYWRFENAGALGTDNGTNGLTLGNTSTVTATASGRDPVRVRAFLA